MAEQWEFQPTHEMSKDIDAVTVIIEKALNDSSFEAKDKALRECRRFLAMMQAKDDGMFDQLEGLHEALRRIRAITTNALPRNIDAPHEVVGFAKQLEHEEPE